MSIKDNVFIREHCEFCSERVASNFDERRDDQFEAVNGRWLSFDEYAWGNPICADCYSLAIDLLRERILEKV